MTLAEVIKVYADRGIRLSRLEAEIERDFINKAPHEEQHDLCVFHAGYDLIDTLQGYKLS